MRSETALASLAAGASVAVGSAAWMAWAVRGRSAAVFGPSLWHGPRDRRALALTFDDGPSESTEAVLDLLAKHGVRATFFQCGANVERLPAVALAVHAAGHELGNHTQTHPYLCFRSAEFMLRQLERAQGSIEEHTGARPVWFRAPYGVRWPGIGAAQRQLGLTGVMWTVIGYDWNLAADAVVRRVSERISNGAIICLHDGRGIHSKPDVRTTIAAVEHLIPMLLDRGYQFETVSRLCQTI
jgi:peptidoglycan/xylan/chitin deacetylase (PgdA/CDA1 family)